MAIWSGIKRTGKKFIKNQQAIGRQRAVVRKDRRDYEKKVQASVQTARRDTYMNEAQKSARIKAKMDAQRRFNPSPKQQASSGMTAEAKALIYGSGFGSPTSAQRVASHIQRSRSPTKKKKKKSTKKRSPQKRSSSPQQSQSQSDFYNLIYNS